MSKREPWEKQPWEERDHPIWDEVLKTPGYSECGDGSISVEGLYAAFKERLMAELVAEKVIASNPEIDARFVEHFPLVSKDPK